MTRRWASIHLLALAMVGCWSKPRPAPPRRDAEIDLRVEQLELPNGVRVVVVPEPAVTDVSLTVRYAVGSADDPAGKEGLAHLVEHLMFEHAREDEAVFDFLERRTLAFNGYTTPDATIFVDRVAPAQLDEVLDVEALRLRSSCAAIPAAAFDRQLDIVRNERDERGVGLASVLEDALFGTHRKQESLAAVTQADACAFVAAHYTTTNAVVVISGNVQGDVRERLMRTLGAIPRAEGTRRASASRPVHERSPSTDAPVDRTWFVLAWPMPADFASQTRLRAVTGMAAALVNASVNGVVTSIEVGSGPSRMIGIAIAPSQDIEAADALANAKNAIGRMGEWFGSGLYEHAKNRAIYRFASSLDHGEERDLTLAYEAAGDVQATLREAKRRLLAMSRSEAEDLVDAALDPEKATAVTLRPSAQGGQADTHQASAFHEERRRKPEDPAEAHRAIDTEPAANAFARAETRTLGNGLRVVLLPLSTMPTVDVRLVLPVGTADEPAGQRGIALVAAHALDAPFDTTMFDLMQAGGVIERDVSYDQTVISARGLASRVDLLLGGIATTIREGNYDAETIRDASNWLTMRSTSSARERIASGAWRDALYGPNHPYRFASMWHHADRGAFDAATVRAFGAAHYRPAGATLVVAGNFDPDNVLRWIDYHFKEWSGAAPTRRSFAPTPRALSFAQHTASPQVSLQVAFPLAGTDAVGEQIVTAMVEDAVADVREVLAATYGLHAVLVRHRLAVYLEVDGAVDAQRTDEAMKLLAGRLAELRAGTDAAAARFVSARRRVVAQLSSTDTRAEALSERVVDTLDSGAEPHLDMADAERARRLTIDDVATLLERIDIANAAILMRGPAEPVAAAFAALGRHPVVLH